MSTQIEILLKARDEATKQIQTAFKNAEQSLTQFNTVAGQTGKTLQKAGKDVSGFNQYMKEGRTENRQFGFVMREVMDIVGGAALMIKLFGGNSSDSEKQAKRLSESVMAGYIAFQLAETIISITTAGMRAYRTSVNATTVALEGATVAQNGMNLASKGNLLIAAISLTLAAGVALYSYISSAEDATKVQEELNKKLRELNSEITDIIERNNALKYSLGQLSDTGYKSVLEASVKYRKQLESEASTNIYNAKTTKKSAEEIKLLEKVYVDAINKRLTAEKSLKDFIDKGIKDQEAAIKKDLDMAVAKNKSLIDLQQSLERKILEVRSTMGLEGITLKQAQLKLEESALRESIEKQFTNRKENNELYKQALDELNNYIIAKHTQFTREEELQLEKRNEALVQSLDDKKIATEESNAKQVEDFILSLDGEWAATQRYYANLESIAITEEDKAKIRAEKQIAIDKHIQDEKIKGYEQAAQVANQAVGLVNQFFQQEAQKDIQVIEEKRDLQIKAIDDQLAAEGISAEKKAELEAQKQALEEEAAVKIKEEKTKAFENQKTASIIEATINTAVAVTRAYKESGIIAALIIGALGVAQIALIKSQPTPKFHQGGTAFINASSGTEVPIMVRGQETVRVTTPEQESRRGGGSITINFNSPVSDTQFVTNSIKKVIRETGRPIEELFVNTRSEVVL